MHIPFLSRIFKSPFDEGLNEHTEKVKECAWAFQQAMECLVSNKCSSFEEHRQEVIKIISESDAIKRRVRGHMPRRGFLFINKYQVLMYLKEEDKILDAIECVLGLLSGNTGAKIPELLEKDIFLLVDTTIEPVEELSNIVTEAGKYLKYYSEKQRSNIKKCANLLRQKKQETAQIESSLIRKTFALEVDPVTVFFVVKLIESIGSISVYAEHAGDMMQAMLS
jgi:predicted phosphate transport protein (TIGR00153 family)